MSDRRFANENAAMVDMVESIVSQMRFALPGIIEEFDVNTNLAKVKSAIQAKWYEDGKPVYKDFPIVEQVPVMIQYAPTQCLCMTLPLKKGDPCLLIFSDRMIDNFVKEFKKGGNPVKPECCGGANKTTEPRMHHLTDAICLPGLYGQPDKIKNWNPNAIEIRNSDRTAYFSLNKNGSIYMKAPGGVFIDTPTVRATHEIIGEDVRTHEGFDANPHLHGGIMPGPANTGTHIGGSGGSGITGGGCGGSSCGDSGCDGSNCNGGDCDGDEGNVEGGCGGGESECEDENCEERHGVGSDD